MPTGIAQFRHDLTNVPRSFLGHKYKDLVQASNYDNAGHFAAFEEPKTLADDVINFVIKVESRKQNTNTNKKGEL